ncbi:hypothetical protein ACF1GW_12305 [Streptomyces achromogenes]
MGKTTYFAHQELDGFIEGPNGQLDWPASHGQRPARLFPHEQTS